MKKRIIGFAVFFGIIYSSPSFAQSAAQAEENAKAQRMTRIYIKSADYPLPDSVYAILKEYAFKRGLSEKLVLKHDLLLKMIYNTSLTKEERILSCDMLLTQYSAQDAIIPMYLVTNMKKTLISSK